MPATDIKLEQLTYHRSSSLAKTHAHSYHLFQYPVFADFPSVWVWPVVVAETMNWREFAGKSSLSEVARWWFVLSDPVPLTQSLSVPEFLIDNAQATI